MERLRIKVNASMILVAGPEAIWLFVSGRVEHEAPTVIRVGDHDETDSRVLAYTGELSTPDERLQILDMDFDVLGEVHVRAGLTSLSIYLNDLIEPDEILVALR